VADLYQKNVIEPIHFIIGPGRSGTTLLMMLLNNHPSVIASPEIKHILYFYNKYKLCTQFNQAIKTEFVEYFRELKSVALNPMFQYEEEKIYAINENMSFAEFCIEVHKVLHNKKSVKVIVDKNPFYTKHIDTLIRIYPKAKFIFLVRDYRGFIHSHLQSTDSFQKKRNLRLYATSWNEYVSKYLKISSSNNENILLVKMEEFLDSPEKISKEICSFLQIDFNEKIFEYRDEIEKHFHSYNNFKETHPRLFKKMTDLLRPISGKNVTNWTHNLTSSEIKRSEIICGQFGEKIGYKMTSENSSFVKFQNFIGNLPWYISVKAYFAFVGVKTHHYFKIKRRSTFKKKHN
jgi:hypothetical protein